MVYIYDREIFCSWALDMNFCSAFSKKCIGHSPVFGALWSSEVMDKVNSEAVWPFLGSQSKQSVSQPHQGTNKGCSHV